MNSPHHVNVDVQRWLLDTLRQRVDAGWFENLRLCLPAVLDLVASEHDQPVQGLAPAIRAVVYDRCTGKVCDAEDPDHEREVERHVQLLIEELEKLRDREICRGSWSENNTPPQMFG